MSKFELPDLVLPEGKTWEQPLTKYIVVKPGKLAFMTLETCDKIQLLDKDPLEEYVGQMWRVTENGAPVLKWRHPVADPLGELKTASVRIVCCSNLPM